MELLNSPAAMRAWSRARRQEGARLALVPTMGYLHEGHLALMREARRHADLVVVSLFVNPIQFDNPTDLALYPRDEARDLEACREVGVEAVYMPAPSAMYASDFATKVDVAGLSEPLCGRTRPGHFTGVTTVVAKLFNAVGPDVAVFGEKDFQQLAVIRRMVRDLDMPIAVIGHPIVREADGLALSSRNVRLTPEARARALALPRALLAACALAQAGEREVAVLLAAARAEVDKGAPERVDYLEIVDVDSLASETGLLRAPAQILGAAFFGGVRLIDNRRLG